MTLFGVAQKLAGKTTGSTPEPDSVPEAIKPPPPPAVVHLQIIWALAVLVFLINYTFEVFVFNDLYVPQHGLLSLFQLSLSLWANLEAALLAKRQPDLPHLALRLALIAQLLSGVLRFALEYLIRLDYLPLDRPLGAHDLGLPAVFVPLQLLLLLAISKLLINAFSWLERRRAAQLRREIENRLSTHEALLRSIQERKKAQAEVLSLRARLERTAYELTENIPVGTYTMVLRPGDALAKFSFMSQRFLELTGLDRATAASDPLRAFACVHPDDRAAWVERNARAFATKAPFWGETRIIVAGRVRWITAESSPRDLPDGSTLWEGVLVDITAQKEAEAALRQAHEELLSAEREQARQVERKRLLQDMHDGFGSQLATARLRLKYGELGQGAIEELLRECLDDLHLVVDTFNSPDHSLHDALVNYRYRLGSRLARLPVTIDWRLALAGCPPLEERIILQLLRIVQEALNNALKHAQARRIEVAVGCEPAGVLHLCVSDDGVGLPVVTASGRGLTNMQSRARSIGGELVWTELSPGTRVSLSLPLTLASS